MPPIIRYWLQYPPTEAEYNVIIAALKAHSRYGELIAHKLSFRAKPYVTHHVPTEEKDVVVDDAGGTDASGS